MTDTFHYGDVADPATVATAVHAGWRWRWSHEPETAWMLQTHEPIAAEGKIIQRLKVDETTDATLNLDRYADQEAKSFADWLHNGNSTGTLSEHAIDGLRKHFAHVINHALAISPPPKNNVRGIKDLPLDDYMKVHDAAVAEYERSTSRSTPYSAAALRRAVDAAFHTFAALTTEGQDNG